MTKRVTLARIPIGSDELVVSFDERRIDIRLWTDSGGVRFASANGLTIHRSDIPTLIDALERAMSQEAA